MLPNGFALFVFTYAQHLGDSHLDVARARCAMAEACDASEPGGAEVFLVNAWAVPRGYSDQFFLFFGVPVQILYKNNVFSLF